MKFFINLCIPSLHNFHFLEMNRENQVLNRKNSADLRLFSSFLLPVQIQWRFIIKIRISQLRSLSLQLHTTIQPRCQSISKNTSLSLSYRRVRYNTYNIIFTILNVKLQLNINQSLEVLYAPTNRCTRSLAWFHFPYKRNFLLMQHVTFHFIIKLWKTSHTPILYFTHIKLVSEVKVSKVY